jgi:hypothetical protein
MLTDDEIQRLKATHGDALVSVEADGKDLVFKKPSRAAWADFLDSVTKDRSSKDVAFRRLALACAVQPAAADVSLAFDSYPALPSKVAGELSDLAGGAESFDVKKL